MTYFVKRGIKKCDLPFMCASCTRIFKEIILRHGLVYSFYPVVRFVFFVFFVSTPTASVACWLDS